MWPLNSPDLNPVEYAVWPWGTLQQQVYHNRKFTTVDQLKQQAIVGEWNKLSQRFIDRSIDEWRRRLMLYSSRVDTLGTFKLSE